MKHFNFTKEFITQNAIKSNIVYGTSICSRGAVDIINAGDNKVEAWVGGLNGKVVEGGGSRRKVTFEYSNLGLQWNCTGNPKNHKIFCKHCVALALYINTMRQS
jgi:uncharacterized Zn finger protein